MLVVEEVEGEKQRVSDMMDTGIAGSDIPICDKCGLTFKMRFFLNRQRKVS